jgi:hypothetical protein
MKIYLEAHKNNLMAGSLVRAAPKCTFTFLLALYSLLADEFLNLQLLHLL